MLLNKVDRRRQGQLEDWEQLVDSLLDAPIRVARSTLPVSIADGPMDGEGVTQYTDTRANRAAIYDYTAVSAELRRILRAEPVGVGEEN